jgi:glycosyltransferase involved in cell wall biosynthesis
LNQDFADISVIIPAYNRAGLIGETLRSLLNQTIPANEIIVVDDGSTDGTGEAAEREFSVFREQFSALQKPFSVFSVPSVVKPSLRVIRQQNAGPGAARNRGLAEATGEFIHFFDSDDIAAPNKHEVQLRALLETGADIAYGPWVKGHFAPNQAQTVARPLVHGVARGSLPLAAQTARVAGATEATELSVASLDSVDTRYHLPATIYSGFTPEGPVLQAWGLPHGDLVRALLTNWSVVPHACLFRRSILEKAGGFPEDIWVGEDQLLFLRCLLAGAKVVHTPETIVFYRLGNDPGKLTATGAAQKRHARDWARFLVKASEEVSSAVRRLPAEAQRRGDFLTTDDTDKHGYQKNQQGGAWASQAGASESDSSACELADAPVSESLIRSADAPASSPATSHLSLAAASTALTPATSYSQPFTHRPSAWFGFRLRAYKAWRDLEKFFPAEEGELKNELQRILKRGMFSVLCLQVSSFLFCKWGGLKQRIFGHRCSSSFQCGVVGKKMADSILQ